MKLSKSGLLNKTAISSLLLTFALMAEGSDLQAAPHTQKQTEHTSGAGLFLQMQQNMDIKGELAKAMNKTLENCITVEKKDGSKVVLSCPFAIPHPGKE